MPIFALLCFAGIRLWWFCCLIWYQGWLECFLLCALNLAFTPFFLLLGRILLWPH